MNKRIWLPFIQFFSGWKWNPVRCDDSISLVHGNAPVFSDRSWPEPAPDDFDDTPSATPRSATHTGSAGMACSGTGTVPVSVPDIASSAPRTSRRATPSATASSLFPAPPRGGSDSSEGRRGSWEVGGDSMSDEAIAGGEFAAGEQNADQNK